MFLICFKFFIIYLQKNILLMEKIERLHKTFFGKTIDLSKIVSISDAKFDGSDDYSPYVYFEMHFQLLDKPIIHKHYLWDYGEGKTYETDECLFELHYCGSHYYKQFPKKIDGQYVAVINLQKKVDELIDIWKKYIESSCD